jgi:hypothetical protein
MNKEDKIRELVELYVDGMSFDDLYAFYVDVKTEMLEALDESTIDEILAEFN